MSQLQILSWLVSLYVGYVLFNNLFHLIRNIRVARRSGIRYIVVPVNTYNRWFSLVGGRVLALMDRVWSPPQSPTSWRWLVRASWPWRIRYAPFSKLGTDTFMTVAPGGCILYTADAEVVRQILGRMPDFPKPTFLYRNIDIFGRNVVTTNGAAWRRHRRLVAPALGEKNNRMVWDETVRQMRCLKNIWLETHDQNITTAQQDAMLLSLNVIGKAGFDQDMGLPGGEKESTAPKGHNMGFAASLGCLMSNILYVVALPKPILRRGPKPLRVAHKAYVEFRQYMNEMLDEKKTKLHSAAAEPARPYMDILGQIIKGQDLYPAKGATAKPNPDETGGLTDSEALGNLFVLLFAGHETTAGTLHFILILLAIHPWVQRKLQAALDGILGSGSEKPTGSSASVFEYDSVLPKLASDPFITAVVNETLRLLGPVVTIPKHVPANVEPPRLVVDGVEVTVPPGTMVKLCASCVHRNPKYWPHQTVAPSEQKHWTSWAPSNSRNDLEAFRPERWLEKIPSSAKEGSSFTSVLSPPFGAYIPFSEGPRACIGKRFAQVELLAAIAVLFSTHSVELAVQGLVPDGTTMPPAEPRPEDWRSVWEQAAEEANRRWRTNSSTLITLQLRGSCIPIKLVERGAEQFWYD